MKGRKTDENHRVSHEIVSKVTCWQPEKERTKMFNHNMNFTLIVSFHCSLQIPHKIRKQLFPELLKLLNAITKTVNQLMEDELF